MNHKHIGEAKDGEILSHIVDLLALSALISTFVHFLRLDKILQALGQVD